MAQGVSATKHRRVIVKKLYASGKTATAGSGAERVGDLKINLKGVNWGEVPRTTAPDNRSLLYQFDATLRMGIAGESGLRTFKLLRNGQEIGTVAFKAQ
ncbi:uncharacterized protein PG998_015107 [Apiospora kogelbergensis]|uniref:Uncharacterized protein n=1 Tax=Apiospora kogelbergensis TaxID=1337665 RepID=A0AAW0R5I0_9PEZI